MKCRKIEDDCGGDKILKLYIDAEFPPNDDSIFKDVNNRPDFVKDIDTIDWKRPHEINEKAELMIEGATSGDIKQGSIGDCYFLSALATISINQEFLKNLIVRNGMKYGYMVFQFFINGEWKSVIIDTLLPYSSKTKKLIFASCVNPEEFWVPLIEKAYAKLHKNYEALNGGKIPDSMVDLSGGIAEKYTLTDEKVKAQKSQLWQKIKTGNKLQYFMGCSAKDKSKSSDQSSGQGIVYNHAYGIMAIEEFHALKLMKLRNPWAMGEWSGAFSDEDEEWEKHKGLKDKLKYEKKIDGVFWMTFEDWFTNFNKFYICQAFSSSWQQYSIAGKWEGKTAGGPYPLGNGIKEPTFQETVAPQDLQQTLSPNGSPSPKKDAAATTGKITDEITDYDFKWFNNPQYMLVCKEDVRFAIISLYQPDQALFGKPYAYVNFKVIKAKSRSQRIWKIDNDSDVIAEAVILEENEKEKPKDASNAEEAKKNLNDEIGSREIVRKIYKNTENQNYFKGTKKKPGYYIIVPNVITTKKEERPFWLRIFSSEKIEVIALPETHEVTLQCEWKPETAGGTPMLNGETNPLWCRNPQFYFDLKRPTHFKVMQ